jgi:hypothetical protein
MQTCLRSAARRRVMVIITALSLVLVGPWAVWAYIGELTYDGVVDDADLDVIEAAFGRTRWSGDPAWNAEADLNTDGRVDVRDLAIAGRSYGSDRNFHQPRRLSNRHHTTNTFDACLDGRDQLHIVWVEDSYRYLYYTRLDRYGNTLIDDVPVDGPPNNITMVAVGCGSEGNAHLIWNCGTGACQARFDRWGYQILPKMRVESRSRVGPEGNLAVDAQGRAHALYMLPDRETHVYAMLTSEGEKAISMDSPLLAGVPVISSRYRELAVDDDDNVHLIWTEEEGEDRLFYARLSADAATSISATVIGLLDWNGSVTTARRPSLALDGQGNAFVLWNGHDPTQLNLDKIGADGSVLLDDVEIFPEWKSGYHQDFVAGPDDQLHLLAPTTWGKTGLAPHVAYGTFTNNAEPRYPMRWGIYGWLTGDPHMFVDTQDDVHLLYLPNNVTADDSPCPSSVLCYHSTAFDVAAYDRTRPDLGIDVAHLDWAPSLARWGESVTVTATVFSAGWVAAPTTTVQVEILNNAEQPFDPPLQVQARIPALSPRQTHEVTVTFALPTLPPAGYEVLEYARLAVHVDPDGAIAETTEVNNRVTAPLMVQPLPMHAGLFLIIRDITPTARGADALPLNTGSAQLTGPGTARDVDVGSYVTVLADVPIEATPVTYTISWNGTGYRPPEPAQIAVGRNVLDPYQVDYGPSNTAVLETDTWGALEGRLTASDTGVPISGATVRIRGQGLSLQVTTDGSGAFSAATEPQLGQLPPGGYTLHASVAGSARLSATVAVPALDTHNWLQAMAPTTKAYVRGSVVNQYGRPVPSAQLDACGVTGASAADGTFDLGEVDVVCTWLTITKAGYADLHEPLGLTAGLEVYLPELVLTFDPPVNVIHDAGGLASWFQDESAADLLPDPPDDATWVEKKLFGVFSDKFWPSYRVQVWWGCYDFALDAATTGPISDRHLSQVQVRLTPKSFESHRVSGSGTVKVYGRTIKVNPGVFQDSGVTTALYVIEARLVNAQSGEVIKTVRTPIEGGAAWVALEDMTRAYDFGGVAVPDWGNAEVWIYVKVGKNESGAWRSSPILRGWHFEQQVLRLDLSAGEAYGDFVIVGFPLP